MKHDFDSTTGLHTYVWTPKEGRALLRRIEAYLKKERERQRRRRATKKLEAGGGSREASRPREAT